MHPAPRKIVETVVAFFIPPACREEVLGDLHERYGSPGQYIADALRTVPLVILSRIRRTTDPQLLLMEALVLYLSFIGAAWLRGGALLRDDLGLMRLAIPAAMALLGLVLADAYSNPAKRSLRTPVNGALCGVAAAYISQGVLAAGASEYTLPGWTMLYGSGMSLLLISALRMLFPPIAGRRTGGSF
jgi:hypothetical protein